MSRYNYIINLVISYKTKRKAYLQNLAKAAFCVCL